MSLHTIVCFGDSLTAFGTWPAALEATLKTSVINAGVGGNTITQGLARFDKDVTVHAPHVVIVGFGTNDQVIYDPAIGPQVSPACFRESLQTVIRKIRKIGAEAVLLTPCVVDSDAYYSRHPKAWCEPYGGVQAMLEQYRRIIRNVAEEERAALIDIGALSAARKDDILGTPDHPDFDGVHPTDTGKALYAQWICDNRERFL